MTIDLEFIVAHPSQVAIGLAVAVLLGFLLSLVLKSITSAITDHPARDFRPKASMSEGEDEDKFLKKEWSEAIKPPELVAGWWLGAFERSVFFLAIGFDAYAAIFAWLAFKVASKWAVWQNIVKVPDKPDEDLELGPRARRALGSSVMQRFLVGTLFNLLAAFLSWGLVLLLVNRCVQ
jgi:hypothetical protein